MSTDGDLWPPVDEPEAPPTGELPPRLGDVLDRVVRGMGAPGIEELDHIFSRWNEVAGDLADHGRPVVIRGDALVVDVDGPLWATEFRYRQHELLDRLAARIGAGRVASVEVRVRPRG